MRHLIAAIVAAILATFTACDTPAGGDRGDSAGDNQPGGSSCTVPAAGGQPAAQLQDGQYVYDVYVELWDEDCTSVPVANKPVHVFIDGAINGEPAQFMGSVREQDVTTPFHVRGFVSPRSAPHQMAVVADVNRGARTAVDERLPDGYLHCRIMRDGGTITVAKGSRDRVTHTVSLIGGRAQVTCHLFVGVG